MTVQKDRTADSSQELLRTAGLLSGGAFAVLGIFAAFVGVVAGGVSLTLVGGGIILIALTRPGSVATQ